MVTERRTTPPFDLEQQQPQISQPPTNFSPTSPPRRSVGRPITPSRDPALEERRGKARERQRRKRQRDKEAAERGEAQQQAARSQPTDAASAAIPTIPYPMSAPGQEFATHPLIASAPIPLQDVQTLHDNQTLINNPLLVPRSEISKPMTDEEAKKERVRRAARERQRKHRAMLKAKRMSQLNDEPPGMAPPVPGMWGAPQPFPPEGMPPFDPALVAAMGMPGGMDPHSAVAPFRPPPSNPTPGQSFANTLLLALSCAPMLKTHLMRSLHMSNPDLESLEQVIAETWDHWDHQRRMVPPNHADVDGYRHSDPDDDEPQQSTSTAGPDGNSQPQSSPYPPPHPHHLRTAYPHPHQPPERKVDAGESSATTSVSAAREANSPEQAIQYDGRLINPVLRHQEERS